VIRGSPALDDLEVTLQEDMAEPEMKRKNKIIAVFPS